MIAQIILTIAKKSSGSFFRAVFFDQLALPGLFEKEIEFCFQNKNL
jgi:hypothetical protein